MFLRYGAPALAFMVVGSVGLARFVKGRNEVADKRSSSCSEQEYEELRRQQQDQWRKQQEEPFDLEAAYESMKNKIDLETWKTVPVPRSEEEEALDRAMREKLEAATNSAQPDVNKRPTDNS